MENTAIPTLLSTRDTFIKEVLKEYENQTGYALLFKKYQLIWEQSKLEKMQEDLRLEKIARGIDLNEPDSIFNALSEIARPKP